MRTSRLAARTSGGAIQASGSRFVRKQVGKRPRVDGVVLHPARADRLGRQGMGHVGGDASVREQISEPAPAIRCLEDDLDRRRLELAEHSPKLGWIVPEPSAQEHLTALVKGDHVRDLAMQVHSEVHHV